MRSLSLFAAIMVVGVCAGPDAHAQITREAAHPHPEPSKFARGVYVDAEMGSLMFLGDARAPLGFGVALGARVGYDFFRWLSVHAHGLGSTHRTDFGSAPQSGQLVQVYQASAELKLTVPLGQTSLFVQGGVGVAHLSTNLLGTTTLSEPDAQTGLVYSGGLGLDYHPLTRHFSLGLSGSYARLTVIESPGAVIGTAYLRYTF